jgi:hypothetical protein
VNMIPTSKVTGQLAIDIGRRKTFHWPSIPELGFYQLLDNLTPE